MIGAFLSVCIGRCINVPEISDPVSLTLWSFVMFLVLWFIDIHEENERKLY